VKKLFLLLLTVTLTACGATASPSVTTVSETVFTTTAETATETEVTTLAPIPPDITVSFCAAGDNLVHSPIYSQAAKRSKQAGGDGYDFTYAYENVAEIISSRDLAVINQETLICNDVFPPSSYPNFNSPVALGDHMIDIGFDVFSIANNHSLDQGTAGLSDCLDYWENRGALAVGIYRDRDDRNNIRVNTVNGLTFSYLSYTESLNGYSPPADTVFEIGDANDVDAMIAEIAKAKAISDVCVVFLHWGIENSSVIEDAQRETAKELAEAGADIIVGTHPHVLRGVEIIERADGSETVCAYSLGNFISAQSVPKNLIGGILTLDIVKDGRSGAITFENVGLIPIVTHYGAGFSDVRIYPFSEYNAELAAAHGVRAYGRFDMEFIQLTINN